MNSKTKILVVEDETIVGIDLKRTLEKLGYFVIDIIRTGEEAIVKTIETKPDLVLMDIMLAGNMNGIQAANAIKKKTDIPVIYLTAYTDFATIEGAKSTDPYGYIVKPYDERVLLSTIEMALYKNQITQQLKESEERYRQLVELSPIAIGIQCEDKMVYVNSEVVKLFRAHDASQIIGMSLVDFVHPDIRDVTYKRLQIVLDKKIKFNVVDERIITLDGKVIDVQIVLIPSEHLGKSAIQIVMRDITEERMREKVQQTALKILQFANSSETLSDLFINLHKTLCEFIPMNNFFVALFDEENKKINFPFYVDEYNSKQESREYKNGLSEYVIKKGESVLLTKNAIDNLILKGEVSTDASTVKKWLGVPIQIKDNIVGVLGVKEYYAENYLGEREKELLELVSFPISRAIERKMVEEEKSKYTDKLRELNQTKDEFFSIISHDLRSPFNSILGYTEILKNELNDLSKEELEFFIDSLFQSTRNIYNLLDNLLQFSKFQMGRIEVIPEELNIKDLIESNIELLNGNILKKEIELINNVNADLKVWAEDDMINSAIQNLLSNAIKFTNRKGKIIINSATNGKFAEISFKDNGIGMDEETKTSLFNLKRKNSKPGTEEEVGTGLGLLLTKEYIEKNGGVLKYESEFGKGSKFSFTVPLFDEKLQ